MKLLTIPLLVLCVATSLKASEESVAPEALREAISRALPLIQTSAVEFTNQRDCFSCHHQALPVLTMKLAQQRGFEVNSEIYRSQIDWTAQFLKRNEERYLEGKGQGGQVDTAGYALWTLLTGEYPADELTTAVAHYLLVRHADSDYWSHTSTRPPTEASDFTTTFLAVQGLRSFADQSQKDESERRVSNALKWLEAATPRDTEDHVFRLRGLAAAGGKQALIEEAAAELWKLQREDGGWGQLPDLPSDPYATGSVLVVLNEIAAASPLDDRYQKGLRFILDSQKEDGTWHVVTRSKPIQEYFETGFPHGADQFISMAATCWATMAITLALPLQEREGVPKDPRDEGDAIRRVLDDQAAAWNSGDLDAFMETYWKSDQLTFSAAGRTVRGWQATSDRYRQRYPDRERMGTLTFSELVVSQLGDDAAMVLGHWQLQVGDERPRGNFTLVLRRIDNQWRIVHDHTSALKE
jgi:uncharacterized protein (TIGR02246 family)